VDADGLEDLAGTRFTFGSESSTSGHLMPRFFLGEDGIDPDADFDGPPGYSGSHDKTFALVEAGGLRGGRAGRVGLGPRRRRGRRRNHARVECFI
jgi:phosphonate transport system substrate-binding protein